MGELELQEVQRVALGLLIEFDKICQENAFRYSLGGGTLLGAIRHGGFIPWDDDIDVMMPRPDYEKFLEYCRHYEGGFDCLSLNHTEGYFDLFSRLSDRSTYLVDDSRVIEYKMGVSIDIFPIDGLGDDDAIALKNFNKGRFKRELLIASKWTKYFRSETKSILVEPIRLAFFLMSRLVNKRQLCASIDTFCQRNAFETSGFAACISGVYREKEIMPTSAFKEYQSIEFEGHDFDIISDYDAYLTQHYGDYMQLPPVEKQVPHHRAHYYWR